MSASPRAQLMDLTTSSVRAVAVAHRRAHDAHLPHNSCTISQRRSTVVRAAEERDIIASAAMAEPLKPLIASVPSSRQPGPPPEPIPVEHSAAYLVQSRRQTSSPSLSSGTWEEEEDQEPPKDENAIDWALRRADNHISYVEANPTELAKLAEGQVGQATVKGMQLAAELTLAAGSQAAKLAVPAGKWALQQGMKVAVAGVKAATSSRDGEGGSDGKGEAGGKK